MDYDAVGSDREYNFNVVKASGGKGGGGCGFADFVLKRHEESLLQQGITQIVGDSEVFAFLADEEDLYTRDDLKVRR